MGSVEETASVGLGQWSVLVRRVRRLFSEIAVCFRLVQTFPVLRVGTFLRFRRGCRSPSSLKFSKKTATYKKQCGVPEGNPALFVTIAIFLFHHKSTTVFPLRKPKIEIGYKCVLHRLYFEYNTIEK